jgi:hypothetical protein
VLHAVCHSNVSAMPGKTVRNHLTEVFGTVVTMLQQPKRDRFKVILTFGKMRSHGNNVLNIRLMSLAKYRTTEDVVCITRSNGKNHLSVQRVHPFPKCCRKCFKRWGGMLDWLSSSFKFIINFLNPTVTVCSTNFNSQWHLNMYLLFRTILRVNCDYFLQQR